MQVGFENDRRSNLGIFTYHNSGSPMHDLMVHISGPDPQDRAGGLGLNRLDFERCMVKGKVLYAIEGDSMPVSQQDEEARIGTLTYAIRKLGNTDDAVEFLLCLETICGEDCDPEGRRRITSLLPLGDRRPWRESDAQRYGAALDATRQPHPRGRGDGGRY